MGAINLGAKVNPEGQIAEAIAVATAASVDTTSDVVLPPIPPEDPAQAKRIWLINTEPLSQGPHSACRVSLMNGHGDVITDGVGSDLVSGLLNVIGHMLPPDHPDYLRPHG